MDRGGRDRSAGGDADTRWSWWTYGAEGVRVWYVPAGGPPIVPTPAHGGGGSGARPSGSSEAPGRTSADSSIDSSIDSSSRASRALAFSDPELEFDREAYPVGVSLWEGAAPVLIGVTQRLARASCASDACFEPTPKAQPVLPCLLRHLLRVGESATARRVARVSAHAPGFAHALEWLLFAALDRHAGPGAPPRGSSARDAAERALADALELVSTFPEHLDVIVSVARKTDSVQWPRSSRWPAIPPRCATKLSRGDSRARRRVIFSWWIHSRGRKRGRRRRGSCCAPRCRREGTAWRGSSRGSSPDPPSRTPPPRRPRRRRRSESERRRRRVAPPPPPRTPPRASADSFDGSRAEGRRESTRRRLRRGQFRRSTSRRMTSRRMTSRRMTSRRRSPPHEARATCPVARVGSSPFFPQICASVCARTPRDSPPRRTSARWRPSRASWISTSRIFFRDEMAAGRDGGAARLGDFPRALAAAAESLRRSGRSSSASASASARASVESLLSQTTAAGAVEWSLVVATATRRVDVLENIIAGREEVAKAWDEGVERSAAAATAWGDDATAAYLSSLRGELRGEERERRRRRGQDAETARNRGG